MKKFIQKHKEHLIYAAVLLLILGGIFTSRQFITPVIVSGHSMDTTLDDGMYGFSSNIKDGTEIERGDIVIVSTDSKVIIKRIIGLPGETIKCEDGIVYINNEPIVEDYATGTTDDFDECTLGENEYFVMGDNREHSKDSRIIGPISKDQIIAKHLFVITSINKFGYHK